MANRVDLPVGELACLYEDGASLRELADRFGISTGTVRSRLAAAGVETRRRGAPRRNIDVVELVYETHLAGSVRCAARRLSIDRETARRRLEELHRHGPEAHLVSSPTGQTAHSLT